MKLVIPIIIFVALFLFMAEIKVTLTPFKIEFSNLKFSIGYAMVLIGAIIAYDAGVDKGRQQAYDVIDTCIQELKEER